MRTVSYRIGDLNKAVIHIGRVAENEYTRVQIDAGEIFAEYPAASVSLTVQPPEGSAYPATVTRDGNLVIWDVKDSDLTADGKGEIQLTFTNSSVVVKSAIGRISVCRSIVASGEAPDPVQDWISDATDVLEALEDAIPEGGTQGQVLAKASDEDYDLEWVDQTGGGGGTGDYNDLTNKPQINGTTLSGNNSLSDLGIASANDLSAKYTKPASGIPAEDIASGVIPVLTDLIDDTAGEGDTDVTFSADKLTSDFSDVLNAITQTQDDVSDVKEEIDEMNTSGETQTTDITGTSPYKNTDLEGKTIRKLLNNNVAGILVISGKNILDFNPIDETITKNNKTVTVKSQSDGSILINGDYESSAYTDIPLTLDEYTLPSGMTFTLSQNIGLTEGIQFIYSNRGISSGTSRTVTLSSASLCNSSRNVLQLKPGTWHFDNLVFKPQVELGSSVTAWEGYRGKHVIANASDTETEVNYECGSTMIAIWNGNASVTLQAEDWKYIGGFNGYINVLRNGVKGDGLTDDSDALQTIINRNRKVYIPSGKYKLTKTITIPSNTEIVGDGESTEFNCLGTSSTLTPYQWSSDYGDDNYFYPYFVSNEATNVIVRDIYIHGNLNTEDQHIHTGLCFYDSDFCVADNVKITKVNYFPANSPLPRPSGQWRRGWAISMFESNNVEVKNGEFTYSPYENVRVGRNCKNVYVHDCVIKYGWRTGLQILRGCDGVVVERCEIIQDDFDTYDTRACITIHTAQDNHIKNIVIRDCKLIGDLWSANGDSGAISIVDYYCENLLVENNIIHVTGALKCIDAMCENIRIHNNDLLSVDDSYAVVLCGYTGFNSKAEFIGNKLKCKGLGVHVWGTGTKEFIIKDNTITAQNNHAVYIGGDDAMTVKLTANGNTLITGSTSNHGIMGTSNATLNGTIIGNIAEGCSYGARILAGSGIVVVGNDFHGTTNGLTVSGSGNVTASNATP